MSTFEGYALKKDGKYRSIEMGNAFTISHNISLLPSPEAWEFAEPQHDGRPVKVRMTLEEIETSIDIEGEDVA